MNQLKKTLTNKTQTS